MDNNAVLNRIFTQATLKELIENFSTDNAYFSVIKRIIVNPESKENGQIISEIYEYLKNDYRNEYFYKNTLLNKLLLGVHKPTTTTALAEISVGKSKADFILINGRAVVYEIKTGLDTFERLRTQLQDYYKAFDHVVVLTDEKNQKTILKILEDSPVGVYLMTKRNQIKKLKEPVCCSNFLSLSEMFKILNKDEFENILINQYKYLPDVPPVHYYKKCKEMFCALDLTLAYSLFLEQLKRRNKIIKESYKDVPYELKTLVYFSRYKENDYNKLQDFLKTYYKE